MPEQRVSQLDELQASGTVGAVAAAASAEAQDLIGCSAFSFLSVSGPVVTREDAYFLNGRESADRLFDKVSAILPVVDRDVIPFASALTWEMKSVDIAAIMPREVMRRSVAYNELWRPLGVERQLIGFFGSRPGSFLCAARAEGERPFTEEDLAAFEGIRSRVDRAMLRARQFAAGVSEQALAVLSGVMGAPALLFDEAGRLIWLTDEARVRFAHEELPVGGAYTILRSAAVDELGAMVRAGLRAPSTQPFRTTRSGEQVILRRLDPRLGPPLFLVTWARPAAGGGIPDAMPRAKGLAARFGLTPRQTSVVARVARGCSNKEIAAELGCAEVTVEFHVTALLEKMGSRNRAELVARFWTF